MAVRDNGYEAPGLDDSGAQAAAARFCSLAFGGTLEGAVEWLRDQAGYEHLRVLREADGSLAASLIVIPMGQYFGGRSVEMEGIAGVAVPPEGRGKGAGLRLMRAQVRDAAARGVPVSCLFASTQSLYRQVGYEQAGVVFQTTLPLRTVGVRERGMVVRELTDADQPAIAACYARYAARYDGMLDRGAYVWGRTRSNRGEVRRGFGFFGEGGGGEALEAYVFFAQRRKASTGRHDVAVSDLAFVTARGGRRLLGFLSDLATVGDDATFDGAAVHPLMGLMGQQYFTSRFVDVWMLRLNLVREALEARGYAPGVRAEFVVEVEDDLVEANAGAWRVRVADGRAEVERARGDVRGVAVMRCDVRGLAAVYAGYCSATSAAGLGWVEGEALAVVDGVFAGDGGWMVDRF
ncbi:MAG: enhanced intracellular survival protein Eis [Phycisphaerales bacterium JB054]